MINFFQSFRENASMRSDCKRCWIIFPKSFEEICGFLKTRIQGEFGIECRYTTYRGIDKAKLSELSKIFQEPCILIVGYTGELSREVCYKLGLAHGCQRQVILVRFQSVSEIKRHDIPACVRANFLMSYPLEDPSSFLDELFDLLK